MIKEMFTNLKSYKYLSRGNFISFFSTFHTNHQYCSSIRVNYPINQKFRGPMIGLIRLIFLWTKKRSRRKRSHYRY